MDNQIEWPRSLVHLWPTNSPVPWVDSEADLEKIITDVVGTPFSDYSGEPTSSDKWLLVSGLQKAIRRATDDLAVRLANSVADIDSAYLWRRLCVIALEDIGFGDPLSCALTLLAASNRRLRIQLGSTRVLEVIVRMLSLAIKDRTLCDLVNVQHFRKSGEMRVHRATFAESVSQSNMPFLAKYMALKGMAMMQDPLWWAVPRQWVLLQDVKISLIKNELPADEVIHGIPASGYDQHNAVGKRAIGYFAKACEPVREILSEHPVKDNNAALGGIIFMVEGSLLDRQLDFPAMKSVYQEAAISDLHHLNGMPTHKQDELVAVVRNNIAALNHARKRVSVKASPRNGRLF